MPIGVVTGLEVEARIARRVGLLAEAAGSRRGAALDITESLTRRGVTALVSFGLAGGLDPALATGRIIVAETVATDEQHWPADRAWASRVADALPGATLGVVYGADRPLASAQEKARVFAATGALAVDMESHAVALVAERRSLPFLALRVITDPASINVPPAAIAGFGVTGGMALGRVLAAIARHPAQLAPMLALAWRTGIALKALARGGAVLAASDHVAVRNLSP